MSRFTDHVLIRRLLFMFTCLLRRIFFECSHHVHFMIAIHTYNVNKVNAESVFLNHGGSEDKDLVKLVNNGLNSDGDDEGEIDTMFFHHISYRVIYQTT